MASDAEDMWRRLDKECMWAWVFCAVARVNSRTWDQVGRRVEIGWKAIVKLQGTDIEAGTVAAALWMGRAIVRLACTHELLQLDEVPGHVQVDCGVRVEDVLAAREAAAAPKVPPAPKPKPAPKKPGADKGKGNEAEPKTGVRKRKTTTVVNLDKLGGPVKKTPRNAGPDTGASEDPAGTGAGSRDDAGDDGGQESVSADVPAGDSPGANSAGMGGESGKCLLSADDTDWFDEYLCACLYCTSLYEHVP